MSKHTPGPWRCRFAERFGLHEVACAEGTPYVIVQIPDEIADSAANARLIAAAPDLLEALEGLRIRENCWCKDFGAEKVNPPAHAPECLRTRSVIKKARGEE